jgi:DNA-binding SARP family transcriptional activator/TolB-like protein
MTIEPRLSAPPHGDIPSDANPRPKLSITVLGPLGVWDIHGNSLLPRVRKTRAVLAILALAAPEPVLRSQFIGLLWSRRGLLQARGSLRQAIHELRLALGPSASLLQTDRASIVLADDGLQLDARQLQPPPLANPKALALWQGHARVLGDLIGLDPAFDRWLGELRQRLWHRVRGVGEARLAEVAGTAASKAAAEQLLTIDPAHEEACRTLIRSHADRGDPVAAIGAYERFQAALAAQSQVGPSAETTAMVTTLHEKFAPPAVASVTLDSAITTLRPRITHSRIRLGVAVLRSGAAAGTAELATALAEEMIVALSRFRWLACVPCTRDHSDPAIDLLLDGAVLRDGDRLRVLLRLTDLRAGGEVLWAERFDHSITEIFTLQDQLANATAARLEPRLWLWEGERAGASGGGPRTAQDLLRLATPAVYRLDRRRFTAAGKLLDQSIELEPDNAGAHAWGAQWYIFAVGQGWASNPTADIQRARHLAERAILLDPEDARGISLAGHVWGFIDRRPDGSRSLHERALAVNPSLPLSWCLSALAHTYADDCKAAIAQVHHVQKLSPSDPLEYFFEMALALAHLLGGDPASSVQAARRSILLNRGFSSSYKTLLAALGHLGDHEAANDTRGLLLGIEPHFTLEEAVLRTPIATTGGRALYAEGLRLGGLV